MAYDLETSRTGVLVSRCVSAQGSAKSARDIDEVFHFDTILFVGAAIAVFEALAETGAIGGSALAHLVLVTATALQTHGSESNESSDECLAEVHCEVKKLPGAVQPF